MNSFPLWKKSLEKYQNFRPVASQHLKLILANILYELPARCSRKSVKCTIQKKVWLPFNKSFCKRKCGYHWISFCWQRQFYSEYFAWRLRNFWFSIILKAAYVYIYIYCSERNFHWNPKIRVCRVKKQVANAKPKVITNWKKNTHAKFEGNFEAM